MQPPAVTLPAASNNEAVPMESIEAPASAGEAPQAPAPPVFRRTFDWRQVESADYTTYIANLRSIGCPEGTIKDIVRADVSQAFEARRQEALAARYQDYKYWENGPRAGEAGDELARQRRLVDGDMAAALRALLGEDALPAPTNDLWAAAELKHQLTFLPPEKQEQVRNLLLRNADIDAQIESLANARRPTQDPEELERILGMYYNKRAQLAEWLTPGEYERLDMTVSWTGDNLRRAMVKFQPTEAEFRMIFSAWRAHDEGLAHYYATGQPDPGNSHVFAAIREQLGEERYRQYRSTWWK